MNDFTYDYPQIVRDILQDARPVNPKRHGNSRDGHMTFFQGTAGRFIVHIRQDREVPVPEVRVLKLPAEVSDTDAEQYARTHQDAFTPWEYMIQL